MRYFFSIAAALVLSVACFSTVTADTIMSGYTTEMGHMFTGTFPDMSGSSGNPADIETSVVSDRTMKSAIWPFGKKDDSGSSEMKPKSIRKAFFLSFLLPGLGETYVGSKRGLLFIGVEALAWWIYLSNTNEGNDLEDDFHNFANRNWHYTNTTDSQGNELDHNYWKWLQFHFREVNLPDDIDPYDYTVINSQLEETVKNSDSSIFGYSVHNLPRTKTQQYYEMIGKYPQFVYGWEDIDDTDLNPTIRIDGELNYKEAISNIKSPLRSRYEDMRNDSNDKLKAGQRGIHIMLINRVVSAIDAARLAYSHNKKLDSELSQIRVRFVEKHIIDHRVPMLMITKKF